MTTTETTTLPLSEKGKAQLQKILDNALPKLYAQGAPSMGPRGCAYRASSTQKASFGACLIGHCITDEACTAEKLEGLSCVAGPLQKALVDNGFPINACVIQASMAQRRLHDEIADKLEREADPGTVRYTELFRHLLVERAEEFCAKFGLKMPNIKGVAQ